MLLEQFLPVYQFSEYHQALVKAPPDVVYQAIRHADMAKSFLIKALFFLREAPARLLGWDKEEQRMGYTIEDFQRLGFIPLADDPPSEMVLGLVGRFWSKDFGIQRLQPEQFAGFRENGYAKVVLNLEVHQLGQGICRLSTETRIQCLGPWARKRFRMYWTLIRPFSGLIRREWLRIIRIEAEAAAAQA